MRRRGLAETLDAVVVPSRRTRRRDPHRPHDLRELRGQLLRLGRPVFTLYFEHPPPVRGRTDPKGVDS